MKKNLLKKAVSLVFAIIFMFSANISVFAQEQPAQKNPANAPIETDNAAQTPPVDKTDGAQTPPVENADGAQTPPVENTDGAQTPPVENADGAQTPPVENADGAQTPPLAKLTQEEAIAAVKADVDALRIKGTYTGTHLVNKLDDFNDLQKLELAEVGASGKTAITWKSSNTSVILDDGTVRLHLYREPKKYLTMTATISCEGYSETKVYQFQSAAFSKPQSLIFQIDALPLAEEITLANQHDVIYAKWAYDSLPDKKPSFPWGDQSSKADIPADKLEKLNAANAKINELEAQIEITPLPKSTELNWGCFVGNTGMPGISDGKSPISGSEIEKKWEFQIANGGIQDRNATPSTPLVIGDYTYCCIANELRKIRTSDGVQVASAPAPSPGGSIFFDNIIYADGKIFVPRRAKPKGAFLIAYDAQTLKQLFVSETFGNDQAESQTVYNDGYIYMSNYASSSKYGVQEFVCIPTKDTDTAASDNVVPIKWRHTLAVDSGDFFESCTGPAFVNDTCIFSVSNKEKGATVYSVDAKTGKEKASFKLPIGEKVCSLMLYYEQYNRVFISSTNTNGGGAIVRSYEVNEDGSLNTASVRAYVSDVASGGTQAAPIIYNDRLYLSGGGDVMGSNEPFTVINAITMEKIYSIDEVISKSTPFITTAYATKENNQAVYTYIIPYSPEIKGSVHTDSYMYIIKDSIGQTEPEFEKVSNIGIPQFCYQSVLIDKDGNLIFYNDSFGLYCYGKANPEITAEDINAQIDRLPSTDQYLYYNQNEIARIRERKNDLNKASGFSAAARAVDPIDAKLASIEKVVKLKGDELADYLITGINKLPIAPDITNSAGIDNLLYLSKKLSTVPQQAEEAIKRLEQKKLSVDIAFAGTNVGDVINAISLLPTPLLLTSKDEMAVSAARMKYDLLSLEDKSKVLNANLLEAASNRMTVILNTLSSFKAQIDALPKELGKTPNLRDKKQYSAVIDALDSIDNTLRSIKATLSNTDYLAALKSYNNGQSAYYKDKVINYIIDYILAPNGKIVRLNKNNYERYYDYALLAEAYYKSFTNEDKLIWNHDNDMRITDIIFDAVAQSSWENIKKPTIEIEEKKPIIKPAVINADITKKETEVFTKVEDNLNFTVDEAIVTDEIKPQNPPLNETANENAVTTGISEFKNQNEILDNVPLSVGTTPKRSHLAYILSIILLLSVAVNVYLFFSVFLARKQKDEKQQ